MSLAPRSDVACLKSVQSDRRVVSASLQGGLNLSLVWPADNRSCLVSSAAVGRTGDASSPTSIMASRAGENWRGLDLFNDERIRCCNRSWTRYRVQYHYRYRVHTLTRYALGSNCAGRRSDWLDGSWIVLTLGLGATGVISYLTYQLLHADLGRWCIWLRQSLYMYLLPESAVAVPHGFKMAVIVLRACRLR